MKKITHLLFIFVLISLFSCGQDSSKTNTPSTTTQSKHYKGKGVEKWIETYGAEARIYYIQPEKITGRVLFVFHDLWGFNNDFKKACDQFANDLDNTIIIGVDLYDGVSANTLPKAKELMNLVKKERANQIIGAVTSFAGATSRIATIGWGFGGNWSLKVATMITHQGVGCVMYYGTPPNDAVSLSPIKCDILGIYGKQDEWNTAQKIQNFEANCQIARKNLTIKTYDAKYGFADPKSENYNANVAQMAHSEAVQFLRKHLK